MVFFLKILYYLYKVIKLKNFFKNFINLFIYLFLIVYLIIIRKQNQIYTIHYSLCLILGSLFVVAVATMLNTCKYKQIKVFYLSSIASCSLFLIVQAIAYWVGYPKIFTYLLIFINSISICSLLLLAYSSLKNFFKKGYSIQDFDFYHFRLILNASIFLVIINILNLPSLVENVLSNDFTLVFNPFFNYLIIVSIIYFVLYSLIEIFHFIHHKKNKIY